MPSSLKYKKSTVLFEVNEVHIGRFPQVRTKLPFLRKCNLYFLFLDLRNFSLLKIPLGRHSSSRHLLKNYDKCKELKIETLITILKEI